MSFNNSIVKYAAAAAAIVIFWYRNWYNGTPVISAAGGGGGPSRRLRLVLVTMEYRFKTVSGNGIYSIAQAKSLAALGHHVLVVCAAPGNTGDAVDITSIGMLPPNGNADLLEELPLKVSANQWGGLGKDGGAWENFVRAASSEAVSNAIQNWNPDAILPVDWHGYAAAMAVTRRWSSQGRGGTTSDTVGAAAAPVVWLNYRVFSRNTEDEEGQIFYKSMEGAAARNADVTVALARADEAMLMEELGCKTATVVLPALREDIRQLAITATPDSAATAAAAGGDFGGGSGGGGGEVQRQLLVCCVRLSPEKGALLFAQVVKELAGFLADAGIRPVLCAAPAPASKRYRQEVVDVFLSANVPGATVVSNFIGPDELATLQRGALLNFHPPKYDSYGMTVVEAAAFGSPSLLHAPPEHRVAADNREGQDSGSSSGGVGAAELLRPNRGESFHVDLEQPASVVAEAVKALLSDRAQLCDVGQAAQRKALSWTVRDNAKAICDIVRGEL